MSKKGENITKRKDGRWEARILKGYAITIHKSQGGEFPIVIIPLLQSHKRMLQRNLLYTGITRAKRMLIIVGDRKAIAHAVSNEAIQRNTRLSNRLQTHI